ncbi:MAG: hypothetical protein JXQ68_04550 [Campylobacterales bacterium]|nr:hypothetical protein [Campylobacterales bacterium]
MRFFSLFTLLTSVTLFLSAEEYTIQLIVAKDQKSIDTVRKTVAPCKVVWHSYVDSKGRNVLTCGRYDSMAAAKKDIALTRKAVPDAFVSTLRVSKKPIVKKEQKSSEVQTTKKTQVAQKIEKVSPTPKPKDKPKVEEVKKAQETPSKKEAPVIVEKPKVQKSEEVKNAPKAQEIKTVAPKTEEAENTSTMQSKMEEAPLRLINITPDAPITGQSQKEEEVVKTNK